MLIMSDKKRMSVVESVDYSFAELSSTYSIGPSPTIVRSFLLVCCLTDLEIGNEFEGIGAEVHAIDHEVKRVPHVSNECL